jgi:hypothetical protein
MTKSEPESKDLVTIYLPAKNGTSEAVHLVLPPAPNMYDMSLQQAFFGQLPYWGMRRTLDAYHRALESGVNVQKSIAAFYDAQVEVAAAKMRWENIDAIRARVALDVQGELLQAEARRAQAEIDRNDAQRNLLVSRNRLEAVDEYIATDQAERAVRKSEAEKRRVAADTELAEAKRELARAEARLKNSADYKAIDKAEIMRARAEAERQKEIVERKLADLQAGAGGTNFRDKRKQLEQMKKDYEILQADKKRDIAQYGSFEAMPDCLQTFYEQLEDSLVQQKD